MALNGPINFTIEAEYHNAENLIFVDSPQIAALYAANVPPTKPTRGRSNPPSPRRARAPAKTTPFRACNKRTNRCITTVELNHFAERIDTHGQLG